MKISAVIPMFNEQGSVGRTVERLLNGTDRDHIAEVIAVDGGSTDHGPAEARSAGAQVITAPKGRASQMNCGARIATGSILYFVHADSLPPIGYSDQIRNAIDTGADAGCMRLCFDLDHWSLRLKCWFTRFSASGLHYGDQSLFVLKEIFEELYGFREDMAVFEDLDIIERIIKNGRFKVVPGPIVSSARKYERNGFLRMQMAFYTLYPMYRMGFAQETLTTTYKRIIRQDKI